MSVGGRVYSSFSTPGQLIPTVSSGGVVPPSEVLIPKALLISDGATTDLPSSGAFTKITFDTVSRDVLVNVVDSTIEILESGTYSIFFSGVCQMPPIVADYTNIETRLELSSVSAPTIFGTHKRFKLYPISGSTTGHVSFTLMESLLAGQFFYISAAVFGSSDDVPFGVVSEEQKTTLSLVKVAPY